MSERGGELVTADEPTVVAEPFLDAIVMEGGQGDRYFADSAGTNKSERSEVSCQTNDLLDQLVASIEDSWWRGWGYPG